MDGTSRIQLVKSPSQSKATSEETSCCSGPCPDKLHISPQLKILQIPCVTCSNAFSEVPSPPPNISSEVSCVVACDYSFLLFFCAPLKESGSIFSITLSLGTTVVNLSTFSRLNQPWPLHLPLCIMSSASLSTWGDPGGLLPVCWYHSSTWEHKNGQSIPNVATPVSSRWENKHTSLTC